MTTCFFFGCVHYIAPDTFELFIGAHDTDLSFRVRLLSGEAFWQAKTPLVIGETQTFADGIAMAVRALNHYAPIPLMVTESFPVLPGCFYEAQEPLWPDILSVVTNDFYQIWTQGLRVTSSVH